MPTGGVGPSMQDSKLAPQQQSAPKVGLISESGVGKTTVLHHVLTAFGWSPDQYEKHWNKQAVVEATSLEGWEQYQEYKRRGLIDESEKLTHIRMPVTYGETRKVRQAEKSIQRTLDHGIDSHFQFQRNDWILPVVGGAGDVGSELPTRISGGEQPQLLLSFSSETRITNLLKPFLEQGGKKTRADKDGASFDYLGRMWHAVTEPRTRVQFEANKYKKDPSNYKLPLKPIVTKVLGRGYLCYTRVHNIDNVPTIPNLLLEVLFISDIITLVMAKRCSGPAQQSNRQKLLQALQACDPDGPWQKLASSQQLDMDLKAISACLSLAHVMVPNHLLLGLGIQFVDTLGTNGHKYQKVEQRKIEEELDGAIIMINRSLGANGNLAEHMRTSEFFSRWVNSVLDPAMPDKPSLSIFISMEKEMSHEEVYDNDDDDDDDDVEQDAKAGLAPERRLSNLVNLSRVWYDRPRVLKTLQQSIEDTNEYLKGEFGPIKRYLKEELEMEGKELDRAVSQLMKAVNVFYAMPMLGIATDQHIWLAKKQKYTPTKLYPQERIAQVGHDTQLYKFFEALIGSRVQQMREDATTRIDAIFSAFDKAPNGYVMQELRVKYQDVPTSYYRARRGSQRKTDLENLVGEGSLVCQELHASFNATFNNILVPRTQQYLERSGGVLVAKAVEGVMRKVERAGLDKEELNVLEHGMEWRHCELPLVSWVRQALGNPDGYRQFVEDLLVQLWQHVQPPISRHTKQLLKTLHTNPGDAEEIGEMVLESFFCFDALVEGAFNRAFFKRTKASGNYKTNQYVRLLQKAWDRYSNQQPFKTAIDNLHKSCEQMSGELTSSDMMQQLRKTLQLVINEVVHQVLGQKNGTHGKLLKLLREQLTGLYKRLLTERDGHFDPLIKHVFKRYSLGWEAVLSTADDEEIMQSRDELIELLDSMKPNRVLAGVLRSDDEVPAAYAPVLTKAINNINKRWLKESAQLSKLPSMVEPSTQLEAKWNAFSNDAKHKDMVTFQQAISDNGLQLQETCTWKSCITAVVAQVLGLDPTLPSNIDKKDVYAFVSQVHDFLTAVTEAEAEQPVAQRQWTRAIALQSDADLRDGEAVQQAVEKHLKALLQQDDNNDSYRLLGCVDLAALLYVFEHVMRQKLQIELFSPAFPLARSLRDTGLPLRVRVAHVSSAWWNKAAEQGTDAAGGLKEPLFLDRFMVLQRTASKPKSATPQRQPSSGVRRTATTQAACQGESSTKRARHE